MSSVYTLTVNRSPSFELSGTKTGLVGRLSARTVHLERSAAIRDDDRYSQLSCLTVQPALTGLVLDTNPLGALQRLMSFRFRDAIVLCVRSSHDWLWPTIGGALIAGVGPSAFSGRSSDGGSAARAS